MVVLVTKFLAGAWIAILAMVIFFMLMKRIRRHYDHVGRSWPSRPTTRCCPTRVHAIVLVSKLHKPTMRALAYAKASRPNVLEAVLVDVDADVHGPLLEEWDERRIDVPAEGARTRRTARSSGRSSSTSRDPRGATRAAWWRSTSRSTSSAAGGSSCCTTRPRCGSRAGCSSCPA